MNLEYLDGVLSALDIPHKDRDGSWFTSLQLLNEIATRWFDLSPASQKAITVGLMGMEEDDY